MSEVHIHPTAIIDDGAKIGCGARVWHWVHICAGATVGEHRCPSCGMEYQVGGNHCTPIQQA